MFATPAAAARPIRALTQMRGYDAAAHVLACFGGAGGQHACAIARALGMSTIFVHRCVGEAACCLAPTSPAFALCMCLRMCAVYALLCMRSLCVCALFMLCPLR